MMLSSSEVTDSSALGKSRNEDWRFLAGDNIDIKNSKLTCQHCHKEISVGGKLDRVRSHLSRCAPFSQWLAAMRSPEDWPSWFKGNTSQSKRKYSARKDSDNIGVSKAIIGKLTASRKSLMDIYADDDDDCDEDEDDVHENNKADCSKFLILDELPSHGGFEMILNYDQNQYLKLDRVDKAYRPRQIIQKYGVILIGEGNLSLSFALAARYFTAPHCNNPWDFINSTIYENCVIEGFIKEGREIAKRSCVVNYRVLAKGIADALTSSANASHSSSSTTAALLSTNQQEMPYIEAIAMHAAMDEMPPLRLYTGVDATQLEHTLPLHLQSLARDSGRPLWFQCPWSIGPPLWDTPAFDLISAFLDSAAKIQTSSPLNVTSGSSSTSTSSFKNGVNEDDDDEDEELILSSSSSLLANTFRTTNTMAADGSRSAKRACVSGSDSGIVFIGILTVFPYTMSYKLDQLLTQLANNTAAPYTFCGYDTSLLVDAIQYGYKLHSTAKPVGGGSNGSSGSAGEYIADWQRNMIVLVFKRR